MQLLAAWAMASIAMLLMASGRIRGVALADATASILPLALPCALVALALSWRSRAILPSLLALFAFAGAAMPIVAEWRAVEPDNSRSPDAVVLVTHNVGIANRDPEATAKFLLHSGADILLLQEARGTFRPWIDWLRQQYPHGSDCRAGCDLAILSRLPMGRVRWKLRDAGGRKMEPPLMYAQVYPGDPRTFMVTTIHLPWPYPGGAQARWRARLIDSFSRIDRNRLVLAGDFNLTPWGAAMRRLETGFAPMRRISRMKPSFPARIGISRSGWSAPFLPIDHVFVGPYWKVGRVETMARTGSDHYPLRITLMPGR